MKKILNLLHRVRCALIGPAAIPDPLADVPRDLRADLPPWHEDRPAADPCGC